MGQIFRLSRGRVKPYNSVPRIDWSHPLAAGLATYCYDIGGSIIDLVNGGQITIGANGTAPFGSQQNQFGRGLNFPIDGWGFMPPLRPGYVNPFGAAAPYSAWMGTVFKGAPATVGGDGDAAIVLVQDAGNSGNTAFGFVVWPAATSLFGRDQVACQFNNSFVGYFTPTIIPGTFQSWGAVAATSASADQYSNGVYDNTFSASTSTSGAVTNAQIMYNTAFSNSGLFGGSFNGVIPAFAMWGRALSANEMLLLHQDPYCFLIYPEDEVLEPRVGIAAAVAALVATLLSPPMRLRRQPKSPVIHHALPPAQFTVGSALALLASTTLAAFGKTTATVKAALSATTAAQLKGQAGLSGKVPLAASTEMAATGRAAPSGKVPLQAATRTNLTGRAGLSGRVGLAASSLMAAFGKATAIGSLPLAARAMLAATGKAGASFAAALSGRTLLSATGKAAVTVKAALSAATTLSLRGMAGATGKVGLAARTTVAMFGKLAALGAAIPLALFAATLLKLSGKASATGTVPLAAKTQMQVTGKAAPRGNVLLAAATNIAVTGRAAFTGAVKLSAATLLASYGKATTGVRAALSAATTITARGSASLSGKVSLGAKTLLSVTGRLLPAGTVQITALAGRTLITLTGRAALFVFEPSFRVAKTIFRSRTAAAPPRDRTTKAPPNT